MSELNNFGIFKQVDLSKYAKKLSANDLAVYLDKLAIENGTLPDPYGVSDTLWPNVSYPDIYNYFVDNANLKRIICQYIHT